MKCVTVKNGIVANSAVWKECPAGWVESDAGIGWIQNDDGSFDPPDKSETTKTQQEINDLARAYLKSTDWYVIRMIEDGVSVPDVVTSARKTARESIIDEADI